MLCWGLEKYKYDIVLLYSICISFNLTQDFQVYLEIWLLINIPAATEVSQITMQINKFHKNPK